MKERPILFSAPMVRAILDGRKTQTRLAVKPQPSMERDCEPEGYNWVPMHKGRELSHHQCPYGQPGDRLWVREAFRLFDAQEECACYDLCVCSRHHGKTVYQADEDCGESKWKPSIHMPRWASRITLEITGIRVERLQDVSETDAVAEGVERYAPDQNYWHEYFANPTGDARRCCLSARESFAGLWKSLYGVDSWYANPWVWAIEFKRITNV